MNNKLGEGNFGEVYKATLSSDSSSPRAKKYAETMNLLTKAKTPCFVAIKVLKSKYFLLTVFMALPLNCQYFLPTIVTSCTRTFTMSHLHLVLPADFWYFLPTYFLTTIGTPCIHSLCLNYIYFLSTFGTSCLLSVRTSCCCSFLLVIALVKCLRSDYTRLTNIVIPT